MRLSNSHQYKSAIAALSTLKGHLGGTSPELKAIALLLFQAADCEVPERMFPYVGDPLDGRDRAIVEAYETEWRRLVAGEDDLDN